MNVADTPRVAEVSGIKESLTKKLKDNEKEVKQKIAELVAAEDASKPLSEVEKKSESLKAEKVKKRMGFIKEKAFEMKQKVIKLKTVKEMSETEVRENMSEVNDWDSKLEKLVSDKQKAEEDSIGLDIDPQEVLTMKEKVQEVVDALTVKIENLKLEDKSRGLFSGAKWNMPKESIVFPESFSGQPGENVFKFKQKFEQAIFDAQIRERDKVEVLRKHLTGGAKEIIGDHHKDLDSAMDALMTNFGQASRIWKKCKDKFVEKLGGNFSKTWGQYGSQTRVHSIAIALEFLREAEDLAKSDDDMEREVFSSATLNLLMENLPRDYISKYAELINGQKASHRQKIDTIREVLELMRNSAIEVVDCLENRSKSTDEKLIPRRSASYGESRDDGGSDCKYCEGENCKKGLDALGCLDLYKKKTKDERLEWLKSKKSCFLCGSRYVWTTETYGTKHKCDWMKAAKRIAKCKFEPCKSAAITCGNHTNNMKAELTDWLKSAKINTKHLGIVAIFDPKKSPKIDISGLLSNTTNKKAGKRASIVVSKEERRKLQTGKSHLHLTDDQLVPFFEEDMAKISKGKPDVRPIPEGEPIFIMTVFKGRSRPVLAFIDSGCNCWVSAEGIPENELVACKLSEGPIPMGVASGITVNASAEWAALLPLVDGGQQVVRGLTVPKVTQEMPIIDMQSIFNSIKNKSKSVKAIQNLQVPKVVGGAVDMIIGIQYQNIYPELVHQYPNGLAVFKSKLMPASPGAVACIGGPIGALEGLAGVLGGHSAIGYMTQLTQALGKNRSRIDFFPSDIPDEKNFDIQDPDIPGIEDVLVVKKMKVKNEVEETALVHMTCTLCGKVEFLDLMNNVAAVQSELKKFQQLQEAGHDRSYRCSKCRDCEQCIKGSGYERISLKQEAEQDLIRKSVYLDEEKGRAMARLPFKADPKEFLADNGYSAQKRLQNICKKYSKEEKVRQDIVAAFDKLRKRGHIKFYEDLNIEQRTKLETADPSYTIPWDVQFKESSLSTPARSVFDASNKTSTGFSLNDLLATGIPELVKLLDVVLEWQVGPVAFVGDVSQFYCNIGLEEESWPFQKLILREDLNPNGRLIKAVITSAIFGVCSSGGQSEEVCRLLSDLVKKEHPLVSKLLLKARYVDDILKSMKNLEEAVELMKETETVLKKIGMNIKGYSMSGQNPPEELTEDGVSVSLTGMTWFPSVDSFKLNISNLHFGKKKRGRYIDLDVFDMDKHGNIENFVENKVITRRNCTSVIARIYDLCGKVAPLTLRFKHDLRRLIEENPEWDDPISARQRFRWIQNFKIIQDLRDIMYFRCPIPSNALSLKGRIWILCDAADGGVMVGAYIGFPIPENRWSCSNLLGKGLLAPEEWTIPKKELQALFTASNVKVIIERSCGDWIDEILVGGDSEIALAWCIYENVKLNVFHRNRVNNIRSKLSLDQLHHVQGPENPTDTGTRPDAVNVQSILPGSEWLSGKEWMRKSHEEALAEGVIKSVKDNKLGVIFDTFDTDENNVAVAMVNTIDLQKIAEREAFSEYIFPPLKRSFRPTVRIISLVILAIRRFKEGMIKARIKAGKANMSDLNKLEPNVKFTAFQMSGKDDEAFDEKQEKEKLSEVFVVNGVTCVFENQVTKMKTKVLIRLSDEDLSAGLEYLFKKTTQEILKFENKKDVEKISVLKDEILFCSTRILEGQELRVVGCLKEDIDLETFTGIKFRVPLISRHSPIAVSLALHMHYQVNRHKGTETTFRLSLQHARILQGRQLFQEVSNDCIYCKKLRLKYTRQLMGPLADTQLSISPIFYFTYLDMWGPIPVYTPGYEKRTRTRKMEYDVYMLVCGCAVTGTINAQIIERKTTGAVLDGLNRFFCETSVPKICYPDQDGALMKALTEGEISLLDLQGNLHTERGIKFEVCLPQGHYAHGRIERRIKMIQDSLERSNMKNSRCTATGWQTIAKAIEREVNSIPLGFLHHQGTGNPLLRVLCPALLRNGTYSDRAPKGMFTIPDLVEDLITKVTNTYNMWFQVWNVDYIPLIMDRPKWHLQDDDLKTDDLVYFKLTDSPLAADWRFGKIEYVHTGRDGRVREVGISYKCKDFDDENNWKHSVVERPARAVVKLMNIEDTSIIDDMKKVQDLSKAMLKENKVYEKDLVEVDGPTADNAKTDHNDKKNHQNKKLNDADGLEADDESSDSKVQDPEGEEDKDRFDEEIVNVEEKPKPVKRKIRKQSWKS